VRSPQEDDIRLLSLPVGARPAARPEDRRQTDDAGGVSGSVAAVDVVRAENRAREPLGEVVDLVGRLRTGEEADRAGTLLGPDAPESLRGAVERLVPGRGAQSPALAHHRLRQPDVRLHGWLLTGPA